jgi:hypothetical protein
MLMLPHTFIRQRVDIRSNPVVGCSLVGIGIALTFVVLMTVVGLFLVVAGKWQNDLSGVGGVIGFMLMPVVLLSGAPWSLVALNGVSKALSLAALIAGPLINGAIIGALYGYVASRRSQR